MFVTFVLCLHLSIQHSLFFSYFFQKTTFLLQQVLPPLNNDFLLPFPVPFFHPLSLPIPPFLLQEPEWEKLLWKLSPALPQDITQLHPTLTRRSDHCTLCTVSRVQGIATLKYRTEGACPLVQEKLSY